MSFSCLNGRIRAIPTPPIQQSNLSDQHQEYQQKQQQDPQQEKQKKNLKFQYSVAASSLPAGFITVHNLDHSRRENENENDIGNGNDDDETFQQYQRPEPTSVKLCHVREVHKLTGGETIVDHCWNHVSLKRDACSKLESERESEQEWKEGGSSDVISSNATVEVLGILSRRMGENGCGHGTGTNERTMGSNKHDVRSDRDNHAASCIRIYLRDRSLSMDDKEDENGEKLSLVRIVQLPFFANSIAMGEGALVIATSMGAHVCDLYQFLPSPFHSRSDSITSSLSSSVIFEWSDVTSLKLMRSYPVHAMHLSHPYLVAASGDRVAIWRVDLLSKIKTNNKSITNNNSNINSTAAIWTTKLQNFKNRITSIDLTSTDEPGRILALSCWDGSVFLFSLLRNNDANGEQVWNRHISTNGTAPWELPVMTGGSAIGFPTFATLLSKMVGCFVRTFVVVSQPDSTLLRCFDVDLGVRCADLGKGGVSNLNSDCHSVPSIRSQVQVHGILVQNQIPSNTSFHHIHNKKKNDDTVQILWIDNGDKIHQETWSYQYNAVPITPSPSRIGCTNDPILVASYSNRERESSSTHIPTQAFLVYDVSKECWMVQCHWNENQTPPPNENETDWDTKHHNVNETVQERVTLSLSFLDDQTIIHLLMNAGAISSKDRCKHYICDRQMSAPQFFINDGYLGIFVPLDGLVIYIYGRFQCGWKVLDMTGHGIEMGIDSASETVSTSNCVKACHRRYVWRAFFIASTLWFFSAEMGDTETDHCPMPKILMWDLEHKNGTTRLMHCLHLPINHEMTVVGGINLKEKTVSTSNDINDRPCWLLHCDVRQGGVMTKIYWEITNGDSCDWNVVGPCEVRRTG